MNHCIMEFLPLLSPLQVCIHTMCCESTAGCIHCNWHTVGRLATQFGMLLHISINYAGYSSSSSITVSSACNKSTKCYRPFDFIGTITSLQVLCHLIAGPCLHAPTWHAAWGAARPVGDHNYWEHIKYAASYIWLTISYLRMACIHVPHACHRVCSWAIAT